jgi:hypothetical protein
LVVELHGIEDRDDERGARQEAFAFVELPEELELRLAARPLVAPRRRAQK